MPLIRDYPETQLIEPTDAFILDRVGTGTMYVEGLVFSNNGVLVTLQGVGTPTSGAWLGSQPFPLAVTFPADWEGVFGWVLPASLPTATAVFSVLLASASDPSGTEVGTVTIATDGTVTGDTSGTVVNFPQNSAMVVYCPDPADATLADFAISFLGAVGVG